MSTRVLSESEVLIPRDPALTNSDEWPEFVLLDAIVYDQVSTEPVSVLLAHENYPLRITGRLEIPPSEDQSHLWQPSHLISNSGSTKRRRTQTVELGDVRSFAYGTYPDGGAEIWAAGKAGWFVLRPSREYRRVYAEMTEAVSVLYSVVDACQSTVGKAPLSAQQLFERYSREIAGDADDAAEKIYHHRDFLLGCMMADREGLVWSKLPIYKHLCGKFPEDVERIRLRWRGRGAVISNGFAKGSNRQSRGPSQDLESVSTSLKRKRGGKQRETNTDVISISSASVHSGTAEDLPMRMNVEAKLDTHKSSFSRAGRAAARASKAFSTTPTDEEVESVSTPKRPNDDENQVLRSKHKSALRLKPAKPTKGLPRRDNKADKAHESRNDLDEDTKYHTTNRNKHKGGAIQGGRCSSHDVDEGIDIPTSPSAVSDDNVLSEAPTTRDGVNNPGDTRLSAMVAADPLQEIAWTCALDGCAHKVYGAASSFEVQALIREHYVLHAFDDDRRVEMVRNLKAPSLPVEHLLERVKRQARADGFPASSVAVSRFPEPLRRKF